MHKDKAGAGGFEQFQCGSDGICALSTAFNDRNQAAWNFERVTFGVCDGARFFQQVRGCGNNGEPAAGTQTRAQGPRQERAACQFNEGLRAVSAQARTGPGGGNDESCLHDSNGSRRQRHGGCWRWRRQPGETAGTEAQSPRSEQSERGPCDRNQEARTSSSIASASSSSFSLARASSETRT